jgi:transposase
MRKLHNTVAARVTKLASRTFGRGIRGDACDSNARALLEHWVRAPTTPQRVAQRSRIVLMALDGVRDDEIASRLDISRPTVKLWTERFETSGPDALLHDAPGRGRPASMAPEAMRDRLREAKLVRPDGLPVSIRLAATFLGVSASSVWRALKRPALARRSQPPKPPTGNS